MEKDKIQARWYEYIRDLYTEDIGNMPEVIAEVESPTTKREVDFHVECHRTR